MERLMSEKPTKEGIVLIFNSGDKPHPVHFFANGLVMGLGNSEHVPWEDYAETNWCDHWHYLNERVKVEWKRISANNYEAYIYGYVVLCVFLNLELSWTAYIRVKGFSHNEATIFKEIYTSMEFATAGVISSLNDLMPSQPELEA